MRIDAKQPAVRYAVCINCKHEIEYDSESEKWTHAFTGTSWICNPQAHKIPEPYTHADPGDYEWYKLR